MPRQTVMAVCASRPMIRTILAVLCREAFFMAVATNCSTVARK